MSARKKSVRAKRQVKGKARTLNIGALVNELKRITEYMEAAREGIAANYYCRDLHRLEAGLSEMNRIISELELAGRSLHG